MSKEQEQGYVALFLRYLWRAAQLTLLGLLVLIAVFVGWLFSDDFQQRAIAIAEYVVSEKTGETLVIEQIQVTFWPVGAKVKGVSLSNRNTSDLIFNSDAIVIPLVLRGGRPKIGTLKIVRPHLFLHVNPQGKLREFSRFVRPEKPVERVPFEYIEVVDGEITVTASDGRLRVTHLQITPNSAPFSHQIKSKVRARAKNWSDHATIDWPDVLIGEEAISFSDLQIVGQSVEINTRGTLPLNGDLDLFVHTRSDLSKFDPLLKKPRALHGLADLSVTVSGPPSQPVITAEATVKGLGVDMPGVRTKLLTYELGDLDLKVVQKQGVTTLEHLRVKIADGEFSATGSFDRNQATDDLVVRGQGVHLEPLLQAFDVAPTPWVNLDASLDFSGSGTLKPLNLSGPFRLTADDLQVGSAPISSEGVNKLLLMDSTTATGHLTLFKDHLELRSVDVVGAKNRGTADLDIGFKPLGPLDLRFDMHHADLSEFGPLSNTRLKGTGRVTGRIHGPFNGVRFDGEGTIHHFSVLGIDYADTLSARIVSPKMKTLELYGAVAKKGTTTYHGDFLMDFRPPIRMDTDLVFEPGGRLEDVLGAFIDFEGLKSEMKGTLSLHGPLFDMNGEADFSFVDPVVITEAFEAGHATGRMRDGRFTLDELVLHRRHHTEGLRLRGSVERKWALNMDLVARGFSLQDLDALADYKLPITGRLSLESTINGTLFDPQPHGLLTAFDVHYRKRKLLNSILKFSTTSGIATLDGELLGPAIELDGTFGWWGEQPYELGFVFDQFAADLLFPEPIDGSAISAAITGESTVKGHLGEVWSNVTSKNNLGEVVVNWDTHTLKNEEPWKVSTEGDSFQIAGVSLKGGATHLSLSAQQDEQLLLAGGGSLDLDWLRVVVPGLEKAVGTAEITTYALGERKQVETFVDVSVDAQLLRHNSVPSSFEDTKATIRATKDQIHLQEVVGSVGGGEFSVTGDILSERWHPNHFDLKLDVADAQMQWVDSLPPAIGDASLTFDGPTDALLLSGPVTITQMPFTDRINWEDWVVEYRDDLLVSEANFDDSEPMFSFDIPIRSSSTIMLRNNVAEGVASADLRLIGDTVRPGIIGTVSIDEGLAFLQDRQFRIDRGLISFSDPWSWNPDLDFNLLTEIGSRDQTYRVNYEIFGPFSDWRTTTRSDPFLPQADVNALLLFGVTTEELEEMGELSAAVAQGVADLLITDFFVSGNAGDLSDDLPVLLFDRIDLATGVDARGGYSPEPRLRIEKRLSDFGQIDLTWEMNLVRPEDNYVSANREIGGVWSLSAWYATIQRDRVLPIGGAYGVDISAHWELR